MVFTSSRDGKYVLMKISSDGGPASELTDLHLTLPSISPDGRWIACLYTPGQNQPLSLAMVPFEGGQPAKVFALPASSGCPLAWTPDGRDICYIHIVNGIRNIWEQSAEGGPPKAVTRFTSEKIFWFDWSRDGRLAVSRGTDTGDAVLITNFQ